LANRKLHHLNTSFLNCRIPCVNIKLCLFKLKIYKKFNIGNWTATLKLCLDVTVLTITTLSGSVFSCKKKTSSLLGPLCHMHCKKKNSLLSGKEVKILKQKNFSQSDFILPFLFCWLHEGLTWLNNVCALYRTVTECWSYKWMFFLSLYLQWCS